jgi:AcrR family transcriptional regulator
MTITELRNQPQQDRSTFTLNCLTEAAQQVAEQHGYDGLTTARVAERAGVSIGTVYRYFADRLAIINAIDPEYSITAEVTAERMRQNAKWGKQNHPDGTGVDTLPLLTTGGEHELEEYEAFSLAQIFQRNTDDRFSRTRGDRPGTWADILLEEVFEALAESDPVKLRAELIQVQAVAQQWVAAIDRRVI